MSDITIELVSQEVTVELADASVSVEIDGNSVEVDITTSAVSVDIGDNDITIDITGGGVGGITAHSQLTGIGTNTHDQIDTAITASTNHIASDGTDHSNVVLNDTHRAGDGSDHANVVTNTAHITSDGSSHSDVAANTAARHAESHTIASHSDTTATGAELEELTDGSVTNLHSHLTGYGDVTAASTITDNAIVRGDGGANGVQDSSVIIDDSGNVDLVGGDLTNIGATYITQQDHVAGAQINGFDTNSAVYQKWWTNSAGANVYEQSGTVLNYAGITQVSQENGVALSRYTPILFRDGVAAQFGNGADFYWQYESGADELTLYNSDGFPDTAILSVNASNQLVMEGNKIVELADGTADGEAVAVGQSLSNADLQYDRSVTGSAAINVATLLKEGFVSVSEFGVTADYVPSTGVGTDWTTEIQAASDYADSIGKHLFFPHKDNTKTYLITGTITRDANGVPWVGEGRHQRWMDTDNNTYYNAPDTTGTTFPKATIWWGGGNEEMIKIEPTTTANPVGAPSVNYSDFRNQTSGIINMDFVGWDWYTYPTGSAMATICISARSLADSDFINVGAYYASDVVMYLGIGFYQWSTSDAGVTWDKVGSLPRASQENNIKNFYLMNRSYSTSLSKNNWPLGGCLRISGFYNVFENGEAEAAYSPAIEGIAGDNNYFRQVGGKSLGSWGMVQHGLGRADTSSISNADKDYWEYELFWTSVFENTSLKNIYLYGTDDVIPGTAISYVKGSKGNHFDLLDYQNAQNNIEAGTGASFTATTLGTQNDARGDLHLDPEFNGVVKLHNAGIVGREQKIAYQVTGGSYGLTNGMYDTANITAFADYSGTVAGTVKATTATAHGFSTGSVTTHAGTTNYNGDFEITVIDATNYYFTDTWVADDATGTSQNSSLPTYAYSQDTFALSIGSTAWDAFPFIKGQELTLAGCNDATHNDTFAVQDDDVWARGNMLYMTGTMDANTYTDTATSLTVHPQFIADGYKQGVYNLDNAWSPNSLKFVDPSDSTEFSIIIKQNATGDGNIASPFFDAATEAKIVRNLQPSPETAINALAANERIVLRYIYLASTDLYYETWDHLDKVGKLYGDADPGVVGKDSIPVFSGYKTDGGSTRINLESYGDNATVESSIRMKAADADGTNQATFTFSTYGLNYSAAYFASKTALFSNSENGILFNEFTNNPITFHVNGLASDSNKELTIAENLVTVHDSLSVTNSVTASSFSGAGTGLTGTATALNIGGTAATATNATNVNLTGGSSDAERYVTFGNSATGNALIQTDANFRFNPSTNVLSVAGYTVNTVLNGSDASTYHKHGSGTSQDVTTTGAPVFADVEAGSVKITDNTSSILSSDGSPVADISAVGNVVFKELVSGGRLPWVSVNSGSSPYTITEPSFTWFFCNANLGDITLNLPSIATIKEGTLYIFSGFNATNQTTIAANGSDSIYYQNTSSASIELNTGGTKRYESVVMVCLTGAWYVIART